MRSNEYTEAVDRFLRAESWTGEPQHAPAVASLRVMARELDREFHAATASAFGLAYRQLLRMRPTEQADSAVAAALKAAMSGAPAA